MVSVAVVGNLSKPLEAYSRFNDHPLGTQSATGPPSLWVWSAWSQNKSQAKTKAAQRLAMQMLFLSRFEVLEGVDCE